MAIDKWTSLILRMIGFLLKGGNLSMSGDTVYVKHMDDSMGLREISSCLPQERLIVTSH
jgi:hypothetical protein